MEFINIVYLVLSLFILGFAVERASFLLKEIASLVKIQIPEGVLPLLTAGFSFAAVYFFKLNVVALIAGFIGVTWPLQLNFLVTALLMMSAADLVHKKYFLK
jgi:hypothetical protein